VIHTKVKTESKGQDRVEKLMEIIRKHPHAHVDIGFFSGAGKYQGDNPPEVVEVALWNEYGTHTSPARPFVGPVIDENQDKLNRWREEAISNIIEKGWTVEQCLEMIGFRIKTLIENKIRSNVPPPNALSTVGGKQADGLLPKAVHVQGLEKKYRLDGDAAAQVLRGRGKTKTLINTGLMLRSVTYKVRLK
jgi:hypothetical protein